MIGSEMFCGIPFPLMITVCVGLWVTVWMVMLSSHNLVWFFINGFSRLFGEKLGTEESGGCSNVMKWALGSKGLLAFIRI